MEPAQESLGMEGPIIWTLSRSHLRTLYNESIYKDSRVEAGRQLGYSETRIAFNEFLRGLEGRIYRIFNPLSRGH
ncbi:hypothetical protein J4477_02480 [Candidatus Pacearchaeota archaeon]|nr:hypothetical protein [Candidatus Pacearchaeota archaeon]